MELVVVKMKDEDWSVVKSIYQKAIVTGNATFYTEAPEWEERDKKPYLSINN